MSIVRILYVIIAVSLILPCCKTSKVNSSNISVIKNETTSQLLTLELVSQGKLNSQSENTLIEEGLRILLFRGIPETQFNKPLIGNNESEIMKSNEKYFTSFFNNRYHTFIVNKNCFDLDKNKNPKQFKCKYSINITALRNDLINNKILANYGF